jgi:DNA polymerase-3 subunit chi
MAPVEVAFHTGEADKLLYACRLLRKAWRSGARVAVSGEAAELQRLDQALWTFEPQEFVPHRRLRRDEAVPASLQRTPIWLLDPGAEPPAGCEVLVNLGPERRTGDEAFRRIVELVSAEPADAQAGRRRWKQYEAQGWPIRHHPQAGRAA